MAYDISSLFGAGPIPATWVRRFDVQAAQKLFTLSNSYRETVRPPNGIAIGKTSDPVTFNFKLIDTPQARAEIKAYFPRLKDHLVEKLLRQGIGVIAEKLETAWSEFPRRLDQVIKALND